MKPEERDSTERVLRIADKLDVAAKSYRDFHVPEMTEWADELSDAARWLRERPRTHSTFTVDVERTDGTTATYEIPTHTPTERPYGAFHTAEGKPIYIDGVLHYDEPDDEVPALRTGGPSRRAPLIGDYDVIERDRMRDLASERFAADPEDEQTHRFRGDQ